MTKLNPASKSEIRNLLAVILSGVLCAFILAGFMLYYYGPTGHYFARNVLLSPSLIMKLNFQETNPKSGEVSRFVFDGIEFSYYDNSKKAWKQTAVSPAAYEKFYELISQDVSLEIAGQDIPNLFLKGNAARLTLKVKKESKVESSRIFQEVFFANEGDYYRVELREQGYVQGELAYFYHPGIYQEALKQLTAL